MIYHTWFIIVISGKTHESIIMFLLNLIVENYSLVENGLQNNAFPSRINTDPGPTELIVENEMLQGFWKAQTMLQGSLVF